jgi:orotate phosphoribosyltransferase
MAGFSPEQSELADLLITTKIEAPVNRRYGEPGNYTFRKEMRATSPIDFAQDEHEFALRLHQDHPNEPLSPVYANLRNLPELLLGKVGSNIAKSTTVDFDIFAGIPSAGDPIAEAFGRSISRHPIHIFDKEGTAVARKIVASEDAPMGEGSKLVLVDDLITGSETKLEAITAAEHLDYQVVGIAVLLDREQGGVDRLRDLGYPVYAPFTLSQLLNYYLETKQITPEQFGSVQEYRKSA